MVRKSVSLHLARFDALALAVYVGLSGFAVREAADAALRISSNPLQEWRSEPTTLRT
jgi:hypothetical protein